MKRHHPLGPATRTLLAIVAFAAICGPELVAPRLAWAKRIVVMPFSGPRGASAARKVMRAVKARKVSAGSYLRAARAEGRLAAARKLGIAAVVRGAISRMRGRWVLRISVISGHNSRIVGRGTFTLRGARLDRATALQVGRAITRHLRSARAPTGSGRVKNRAKRKARTRKHRRRRRRRRRRHVAVKVRKVETPPPPKPKRPPPAPKRRTLDDGSDIDDGTTTGDVGDEPKIRRRRLATLQNGGIGGFAVAGDGGTDRRDEDPPTLRRRSRDDDDDDDNHRRSRGRRHSRRRPAWETIIEAFVGLNVQNRSFGFNDPVKPKNPPTYKSGIHTALTFRAVIYPGAAFTRGAFADLGIVARYDRVLGLKSQVDAKTLTDTLSQTFEIGVRYRWNILRRRTSPVVMVGVEYGRQMFFILSEAPPLPNITYNYVKLALARAEWPFFKSGPWRAGLGAAFDYLLVFNAGDIENEDSSGFGRSSTGGINAEFSLFGGYGGFTFRAELFYRRYFFDFDRLCAQSNQCSEAGGALDTYTGGTLNIGYQY